MEMSCPLSRFEGKLYKTRAAPLPGAAAQCCTGDRPGRADPFSHLTHVCGHAAGAMAGRRRFLAIERESVLFGQ